MNVGGMGPLFGAMNAGCCPGQMQTRMQEKDPEEFAEEMANKVLEQFDADGDGVLSTDEFDSEVITRADTDGDGLASLDELKEDAINQMNSLSSEQNGGMGNLLGMIQMRMQGGDSGTMAESMAGQIMEMLDEDGDGVISTEEVDDDRLSAADTDGDGSITLEELTADIESHMGSGPPPPPPPGMGQQGTGMSMFGGMESTDSNTGNEYLINSLLSAMTTGYGGESQTGRGLDIIA